MRQRNGARGGFEHKSLSALTAGSEFSELLELTWWSNCHSLCLFTAQRKHATSLFINITLIKKNMPLLPTKGLKIWYVSWVPCVTGALFFHRLLSTPVGELLRSQPVQLQKAAALQEIQHAVNSSTDTQIPVVDSYGVQAKLFLYSP